MWDLQQPGQGVSDWNSPVIVEGSVSCVPGQEFLLRSRLGVMQGDPDVQAVEEKS